MNAIGWFIGLNLLCFSAFAADSVPVKLKKVRALQEEGRFVAELEFNGVVDPKTAQLEFINRTIQINIPGSRMEAEKNVQRVKGKKVRSIYTYQASNDVLRSRIILNKPLKATDFKKRVSVEGAGRVLRVAVVGASAVAKKLPVVPPMSLEEEVEQQLNIFAKDPVLPSALTQDQTEVAPKDVKESEIPVLTSKQEKKSESSNPFIRMIVSLGVIFTVGIGLIFFGKWWNRRNKSNPMNNKIDIVTQHHLGPKRSLAIARVAGEYILLGVTDQNINMIKTLSFIDDEMVVPSQQSFEQTLNNAVVDSQQPENEPPSTVDEFSFGSVKDMVSSKLKEMKRL